MIQAQTIGKGQKLVIDLNLVKDRLPSKLLVLLNKHPFGTWWGEYKLVDGGVGLILELDDGTKYWFFEEELHRAESE